MAWQTKEAGWKRRRSLIALLGPVLLSSCAAAPLLLPVAFEFARNLIQTGLSNYGSKHRDNLSVLVDRLSSPYMQGLPPMAMGGLGLQGQPGLPVQPGMSQQAGIVQQFPGQAGGIDPNNPYATVPGASPYGTVPGATTYPGGLPAGIPAQPPMSLHQYPGQQTISGQPGVYDPNNPYGSAGAPYQGGVQGHLYGTPQAYPPQPGMNPFDPSNPYGNPATNPYGQQNPYGAQIPYGQQPNPYGQVQPYGGASSYPPQQGYDPNNPYGMPVQPGYGQVLPGVGQPQSGYGVTQPYGQAQQPQAYGAYGMPGQQPYGGQPYGAAGIYPRGIAAEPVAVDVAMIRQKQMPKGKEVVLMTDGEVLKDGGANPAAGDRFKIVVRTNCDCHLYIMSIDGSSWTEPVFPRKDTQATNPVRRDQEYAFPEAGQWYTLDQIKGIETFFVVASANRRTDLEESFAQLGREKRPDTKLVAKVEEPPIVPRGVGSVMSRGIVRVQDDTGAAMTVTPLSYAAPQAGLDVTVTRWFKHE